MANKTLEELYENLFGGSSFNQQFPMKEIDQDRFKSVLHPDYSEYSTSTVTGSLC